ncbi:MarR family transcriptional regulator [Ilumatobacter sp.]|uniref:MarR family transcriptional regulator n=1 Tax=Ilumatobacter sp. TaxID=1967498 RepID=UPI003B5166D4
MTGLPRDDVELHLRKLSDSGYVTFRENRGLWQLTPDGRVAHGEHLEADLDGVDARDELSGRYPEFVEVNSRFKELCGDWQLRDGHPNDHSDEAYDAEVVHRLATLHERARPIVASMGDSFDRLEPYAGRLDSVLDEVRAGDTKKFTGVMCNSYHDVWMELHEDLILTQGIDRDEEGSY